MVLHLERPLAVSSFIVLTESIYQLSHHYVSIEYWVSSDLMKHMKSLMTAMPNLEHVERADGQI